jgi:hypothetical protein
MKYEQDYTSSMIVSHLFDKLSNMSKILSHDIIDKFANSIKKEFGYIPEISEFLKFGGY